MVTKRDKIAASSITQSSDILQHLQNRPTADRHF